MIADEENRAENHSKKKNDCGWIADGLRMIADGEVRIGIED